MKPQVSMVVSAAVLRLAGSVWGSAWRQDETSPSASHSHTRMVRVCVLDCTGSPPSDTVMGRWYTLGDTQPLRRVRTLAELSVRQTGRQIVRQADRQTGGMWEQNRVRLIESETVTVVIYEGEVGIFLRFRRKCVPETLSSYRLVRIFGCYWLDQLRYTHAHTSGTEIRNTLHIHVGVFTSKNVYLPCSCAGTQENFVIVRY